METCDVFPFEENNFHQLTKDAFAMSPAMRSFSVNIWISWLDFEDRIVDANYCTSLFVTRWKRSTSNWTLRKECCESQQMELKLGSGRTAEGGLLHEQKLETICDFATDYHKASSEKDVGFGHALLANGDSEDMNQCSVSGSRARESPSHDASLPAASPNLQSPRSSSLLLANDYTVQLALHSTVCIRSTITRSLLYGIAASTTTAPDSCCTRSALRSQGKDLAVLLEKERSESGLGFFKF
ncbi:uncharacterized protein PAC_04590 [Phialocephala subalpina]|uniref:Uncharacterized protein n=1 Tax=Phialocephala subalpina TaxID=576137 RepID=A0A1L7WPJ9_9HELO|nr:uncharacterized protein PAC_04590 [Phialocephala subalpina]